MFRLFLFFFLCATHFACAEGLFLDWETAWQRLVLYSPEIAIAEQEICARIGEKLQVSLLPNPIATIEGDNLGVHSHNDDDAEPPETTFAISQLIELGGKRFARRAFAASLEGIAFYDVEIARRDLKRALAAAFIDVSAAQEMLNLAQGKESVAQAVVQAMESKVDGGKISPIQEKKAHLALMAAHVCSTEAFSVLEQAKKRLAAFWGCPQPDFEGVNFALFECFAPPCCCAAVESLFLLPDYEKAQAEIFSAEQNFKLQITNSLPDVSVTVGYRIFNDSGQHGWIVGAEFPLPFFDRNQGNIRRACAEKAQAVYQLDGVVRDLKEQILVTHERLSASFEESKQLEQGALMEAMEIFNLVQTGYQNGKFEYLDLLDAQTMLFEIQEKYVSVLRNYHISRAELERLTGGIL